MTNSDWLKQTPVPATNVAQQMIDAAICAYSITHGKTGAKLNAPSFFYDPIGFASPPMAFASGFDDINAAFLGIDKNGWAILSLRGTLSRWGNVSGDVQSFIDWLNDLRSDPVPLYDANGNFLGNVEDGWRSALSSIWQPIRTALHFCDWANLQGLRITGHSKGAGLTFLAAALANAEKSCWSGGGPKKMEVHAFAAPLAGDGLFAQKYNTAGLGKVTTRYQRANDIVPFVPRYTYNGWSLFDELPDSDFGWALWAVKDLVGDGYELLGDLSFYADKDASGWPLPVLGPGAHHMAQAAIIAAIAADATTEIKSAHSAVYSYWPAIFSRDVPAQTLSRAEMQAKLEATYAEQGSSGC